MFDGLALLNAEGLGSLAFFWRDEFSRQHRFVRGRSCFVSLCVRPGAFPLFIDPLRLTPRWPRALAHLAFGMLPSNAWWWPALGHAVDRPNDVGESFPSCAVLAYLLTRAGTTPHTERVESGGGLWFWADWPQRRHPVAAASHWQPACACMQHGWWRRRPAANATDRGAGGRGPLLDLPSSLLGLHHRHPQSPPPTRPTRGRHGHGHRSRLGWGGAGAGVLSLAAGRPPCFALSRRARARAIPPSCLRRAPITDLTDPARTTHQSHTRQEGKKERKGRATMYVTKRDGRHEAVQFDKITARIKKLVSEAKPSEGMDACACMPTCTTLRSVKRAIDLLTDDSRPPPH